MLSLQNKINIAIFNERKVRGPHKSVNQLAFESGFHGPVLKPIVIRTAKMFDNRPIAYFI